MEKLIKAAKALSDETRIRILNLLLVRECCVCEVMQVLDISQTRASRNLNLLYDAGFLKLRKEGLWAHYSVKINMHSYLADMLTATQKALTNNNAAAIDKEHLKKAIRIGLKCARNNGNGAVCAPNA
jgi:ArsR family transcriptional regulator, arsenate/arsenite/antimonite-responsive transcriptional repressor